MTITGPVAARRVTGRFTAMAPAGDRFFALTTPLTSAASYVQGEIIPGAGRSWSVTVSIGSNGSYPAAPDRVTIVLATPSVAAILAKYQGRPGTLRPVPRLSWRVLAILTVTRKPSPATSTPRSSIPPAIGIAGLVFDGHHVTSGRKVAITGPVAARRVTGRFTAMAPAGDRFFALTTPLTSASTAGQASYVQGEIIPGAGRSWSVTVSIGSNGSYPAAPDRVTIVLATPSVAAILAKYQGRPGTLRPVPHLSWRVLATITVTRRHPSGSPSPTAAPSPAVGVTGLQVDGRAVTSGQQVAITGPVAARRVTGRFTATAAAGDRFFALTTPLTSATTAGQASYVQGEIIPGAGRSWSVTVSIGSNGSYPAAPDRVTIVLASPSVAATLAGYEGQPGTLRPIPALTWQTLATITITRKTASAPN